VEIEAKIGAEAEVPPISVGAPLLKITIYLPQAADIRIASAAELYTPPPAPTFMLFIPSTKCTGVANCQIRLNGSLLVVGIG